ncbi:Heavy metal-associated domain superfamily, partial [Arabidopsis suecica]
FSSSIFCSVLLKMMKMIVWMGVYDQRSKGKILKSVADLPGIHYPCMDLKEGTLTLVGDVNPVEIVNKLRKKWGRARLTLFVPYDALKEAKLAEAKQRREEIEREALYRYNREIREIVNDQ